MQSASLSRLIFQFDDKPATPDIENVQSIRKAELSEIFLWRSIVGPPSLPQDIAAHLSAALLDYANSTVAQQWVNKIHA